MLKKRVYTLFLLAPLLLLFFLIEKGPTEHMSYFYQENGFNFSHLPAQSPTKSILYTFFELSLPDAIISPATSIQVGFVEALCIFLLAFFLRYQSSKLLRLVTPLFIYAYLRKLFSSLIIINAP